MKNNIREGFFVVCEGIDGSGKTTLMHSLAQRYDRLQPVVTHQPGGTPFGADVRAILKKYHRSTTPVTQSLLFAADRSEHISLVIKPALELGRVIFCDRMIDSSLIYQGALQNIASSLIWSINKPALQDVLPDITLYCRVEASIAFERVRGRLVCETFDDGRLVDFEKLVEAYDALYADRDNVIWLDASQSEEKLEEEAYKALQPFLGNV